MLESLVANLLNRFLGMYVKNFDPKQLNVGIWSGDVTLRDMELRREALDQLKLPLNVVEGHLGLLTLSIPWSNLRGKPVKIDIQDVYLLAAPREDADVDPAEEERRAHAVKMEKLDSAELLKERNTEGMSQEEQQKQQSFTSSLVTAIVDNVQITVKNIHVRYEDSISDPGHPFALGITLEGFDAVSTDGEWRPTFIQSTSPTTHKLASLKSLAVYWDTDAQLLGSGKGSQKGIDHEEFLSKFKSLSVQDEDGKANEAHQFILKPVTGRAGLEMDKTGKTDRPKIKAKLLFDELGFVIDDDQYRDALMLVDLFHYFVRHQEYKKFQPKSSPEEDPQAWIKFAGQAVLDKIHDRNKRWSWAYFKERRDDRIRYIELFKKRKREEKLTPEEAKDIDALEHKLTYEDLRFWRSLARNQLRKENVGVKKAPQKQTWSQWVWGGGNSDAAAEPADDSQMSEQQRKELYNAISFDEKQSIAEAVELPKEYVKMQVDLSLRTGSFTLKRDPHGKGTEILKLLFDSFKTQFLQRPGSFLAKVTLEGMRLYDGTTEGNLFPQMITIKGQRVPQIPDEKRIEELDDGEEEATPDGDGEKDVKEAMEETEEGSDDPLFQLEVENNPLDGSADTALNLKLKGMELVYNPAFLVAVVRFFRPPDRHMESINALMESAGKTVEGIRQQTRAGLEFALEEHKTVNAKLDIQAPLIIVPDSVTSKSTICLIIDAGHVSVQSELVDKETLSDVQAKQRQKLSDDEFKRLESLMYDKFNLRLESTQVLIGTTIDETRARLNSRNSNFHLVDKINVNFLVETCIVPKGTELTKFRISGNLPVLHASISDQKYKSLMKVIDFAIPKFGDDGAGTGPVAEANKKKARTKSIQPNATGDENRRKSFAVTSQRHELVMEEESVAGDPEASPDAQESKDQGSPIKQRNFEFKFTVDKLQGSLFKADPEGKKNDQLLVELVAEGFLLDFYQRPFDMAAEVKLRTLAVVDHIEEDPLPEFKNIIESEKVEGQDLFELKFMRVNKDSPEFLSEYEGIATNLDIQVSTINFTVTRKTLLTLLDFVLLTFTNPGAPAEQQPKDAVEDEPPESGPQTVQAATNQNADKIRVRTDLKRIAVILNNDGIRLATLGLNTAKVSVFLMGKTMSIGAHLGDLQLIDDVNQGVPETSSLRRLVTIEGDELADFGYETFDEESSDYPGHDASINLRAGSLKVNFVTEPFRKIMDFGVKFGKMQAIFNAARQAAANQAAQVQQRASKMHFDIVVKTPIIVFPRMVITDEPERDALTAELGEIYANNSFVPSDESKDADLANKISAGVRNIRLLTLFHYEGSRSEELQMIDKLDLDFKIKIVEHKPGCKRPDMEIQGSLSDLNLKITQEQMRFALELSKSIPAAFATDPDEEIQGQVEEEVPKETLEPAKEASPVVSEDNKRRSSASLGPELGTSDDTWTKLDLVFKVGAIGLELIKASENEPIGDVKAQSLSAFALNNTHIKVRMISDGALESELLVQSLSIRDTRTKGQNKFRKIMSLINTEVKQQFMASVSISSGAERNLIALLTIDSPRLIFSLDYVFALKGWLDGGLATEGPLEIEEQSDESSELNPASLRPQTDAVARRKSEQLENAGDVTSSDANTMSISFRVDVVDAQIVLIANPAITTSEAIVLGTKQVLIARQHATTLQVEKVGMFLCRMDRFEDNRLRILDDFSIQTSLDMRSQGKDSSLTSINVDIEPLVLRLSLRDILLAMQIVNRATAMANDEDKQMPPQEPKKLSAPKGSSTASRSKRSTKAPSTHAADQKTLATTKSTKASQQPREAGPGSAVITREEMRISVAGIRVVLIGDKHELPMLDWSVKNFDIDAQDWSANLTADTRIDTFFNIYNFSKSAWEPLIEPWSLGFHMSKATNPDKLAVELYSRKSLELTVTTATIALASKSFDFLSGDEDVLTKPRGMDAPYRIQNYTGFDINVWAESRTDAEGSAAKIEDGHEIPWRFEDALTTRETLSADGGSGVVGVRLEGSGFNSVDKITVSREGEKIYNLYPKQDKIQHRLLIEVKLGADNIKYITFRSPLLVENNTQIPVEIGVFSPEDGHLLKIEKIAPGDGRPAPVGAAYMHSLIVRPDQGFGYTWSRERLFWRDLLKRRTRTLTCRGENEGEDSPPFYFQMHASFDEKNPLTSSYPYMRIKLHAPVEVQNLLPFDFQYRMFDHNTKKDWKNFLRKGGVSPVHVVELQNLLMLSIDMQDTPFKASEFTVINSSDRENFKRERTMVVKDNEGLNLRLKLQYFTIPDSGGAFKVTVYSPYILLNRTGLELDIRSKQFLSSTKPAAGQSSYFAQSGEEPRKQLPLMFNFPTDDKKNRALFRVGDSEWSKPQSFDAIGSTFSVTVASSNGRKEMDVGVSIDEGEGKYNITRVVTIAPRYIVKNKLGEDVNLREPGSSDILTINNGELLPLRFLRQAANHQLSLCYPGVNNAWSSPFNIANVGNVHVKLAKAKQRQRLIRIDILMEGATLFLHLSIETKHWPFSMRNESNQEFLFWQANPNVDDDDEDDVAGWKPIRYRLPPRSIMPYAWDYPAARRKEIILQANKKEKAVKLAEIGNPPPMRIPPSQNLPRGAVIDLNIIADGPTQTLILSNFKQSKSLYRQKSSAASTQSGFEVKDMDTDVTFSARLSFAGVGVSLVNRHLKELVYLTLRDIELKYSDSPVFQTVKATIKWIQIDNQLYGGIFPIIFYPSVVPKTGKEMEAHPILHTAITRVKDDSYGVLYIKYFTVLLQQMTLEIDEDFIFALLDFAKIPGASWSETKEGKLCEDSLEIPEPQQEQSGQDIYFEFLHLQPMQFDISFVRTERINAEQEAQSSFGGNPLMFFVNVVTMSIGNVNDAPIRFNALMLENARVSTATLINNVKTHYVQESLRQVHVVIGSADFLGNPVGLFNNLSSGVQDIFYEPYQGLVMTDRPQDLGLGIAKGAGSFVKKSIFGFSDSMAKFTGSVSKGLAAASMDKEFQDRRRMSRNRNRPKHALYGITSGGNAFAESLASGIGGLARHPMQGAEKEGAFGFAKGVAKGVIGLGTKPLIGALDLASNMAEGVRNTTTVFDQEGLDRVRLTRFIGTDGIVRPYSQREALGQFWLKTVDSGKYFNEEYIAHLELSGKDLMVMLTYNNILLVKTKRLQSEWDVPLKDVQTISKERTGIGMMLKGGVSGPFLPVGEEESRNWLYRMIAVAVNAYNEKWGGMN